MAVSVDACNSPIDRQSCFYSIASLPSTACDAMNVCLAVARIGFGGS